MVRRIAAHRQLLALALVVAVGAALRFYGMNWDGGQWLQPDERQIYFVALELRWPSSLALALSPASPLNPHFFAYGSLPIYLLRLAAALAAPLWPAVRDPNNLHFVGRLLAALLDLGTIVLTYRLARRLWPAAPEAADPTEGPRLNGGSIGLLAAAMVSVAVLHIQLAHFYTADPLLVFWVMLTLNVAAVVARHPTPARTAALGVVLGLALATKVSAAPLVVLVMVALRGPDTRRADRGTGAGRGLAGVRRGRGGFDYAGRLAIALGAAALAFVVAQPYALIDWREFLAATGRESQIAWGRLDVPYTRQYAGTLPYLYPAWQMALWSLGLPAGLPAWSGLAAAVVRWLRYGRWAEFLLLAWAGPALAISGALYAKYLRYLLPVVPVLCLLAARLLVGLLPAPGQSGRARLLRLLPWAVLLGSTAYALAFETLYTQPHSWIRASEWIYRRVPAGSTLAVEAWDTALPLPLELDGRSRRIEEYELRTLELYDRPDDGEKWARLAVDLADADYVVVASRRGYGSLGRQAALYPLTSRYYRMLFGRDLGFEPAGEFTRGPGWLAPRVPPLPGAAPGWLVPDESLEAYDHPRALIYRNVRHLSAREILERLGP